MCWQRGSYCRVDAVDSNSDDFSTIAVPFVVFSCEKADDTFVQRVITSMQPTPEMQEKIVTTENNVIEMDSAARVKPHPAWLRENEQHRHTDTLQDLEENDIKITVLNRAIQSGQYVRESFFFGTPKHPESWMLELQKHASPLHTSGPTLSQDYSSVWVFNDGMMKIGTDSGLIGAIHRLRMFSLSDSRVEWFNEWIATNYSEYKRKTSKKRAGLVYMLTSQPGQGLSVRRIGAINAPFVRENYSADVLNRYDLAIADLNSDSPSGRIVIMDGPPGTGKTWLVRAMTHAADCAFVFVPPALAKEMGDPSIVPVLMSAREEHDRIALVFEDADQLLSPRKGLTMESLATILNLGDGILGELLNVRVICTTNSRVKEIDDALLRPGRLSARIAVNALTPSEWHPIYTRLTGKKATGKGRKTLADVYAMARG